MAATMSQPSLLVRAADESIRLNRPPAPPNVVSRHKRNRFASPHCDAHDYVAGCLLSIPRVSPLRPKSAAQGYGVQGWLRIPALQDRGELQGISGFLRGLARW